jgi:2-polyprenyl-3-methyl-5-hydroxy-6-metoxy-1,4-benzoquinol methylase
VVRSTADPGYARRLDALEHRRLARWFDVQAPYRWNIRRIDPGFVLDVGCGLGRNLAHLDGHGVGVDHSPAAIEVARSRGLTAFTPTEFRASEFAAPGRFDSLLLAHVIEHLAVDEGRSLVLEYLPDIRPGGRVIVICPARAGYRSDPTHVTYYDPERLTDLASGCGLRVESVSSFPFPSFAGRLFRYNESILVARIPE